MTAAGVQEKCGKMDCGRSGGTLQKTPEKWKSGKCTAGGVGGYLSRGREKCQQTEWGDTPGMSAHKCPLSYIYKTVPIVALWFI